MISKLVWHKVAVDGNPSESGTYYVHKNWGDFVELPYSKKHNLWNAYDSQTKKDAKKYSINSIDGWATYDTEGVEEWLKS